MSIPGKQRAAAPEGHEDIADPVQRDDTVAREPLENIDETLIPSGKDHREPGPSVPDHDQLDPALQPDPHVRGVPKPPPGATRRT